MKTRLAWIFVMVLGAAPAMAEDLDFTQVKCKEFVSAPKDQIGTILVWLEGYYTKENSPPIMYSEKTTADAKSLSTYCNAHPDDSIITAAEAVMPAK